MSLDREAASLFKSSAGGVHAGKMAAVVFLSVLSSNGAAQDAESQGRTGGRALTVVPRVSVQETWTNNANLGAGGKRSDFITEISPGVSITSNAGRLKGTFDYTLRQVIYANEGNRNNSQNSLNASGVFEAIENQGFIEASSSITRQTISAFGVQSIDPGAINPNATEVTTLRVSPYFKGRLASIANYELRQTNMWTRADAANASNVSSSETSARLNSQAAGQFAWSLDLNRQDASYALGRRTESERARAVLTYLYDAELSFRLIGGQERNNYTSSEKEGHSSMGGGFTWTPNNRTKLSAETERRFFGNSRNVSLEYRTARTAWRFSDSKDISIAPSQSNLGGMGTLYDQFFFQFASIEPDPIRRAQLVNSFLLANGLNPRAPTVGGYLTSGVSLQSRQDISFTLTGLRDTVSFIATRNSGRQLDGQPAVPDDFTLSRAIRQMGYSVNYARRLTPDSSLNVLFSTQRSMGDQGGQDTNLRSLSVNWSSRIGLKTTATLGMRRSTFDSAAQPYNETAVMGSVSMQF